MLRNNTHWGKTGNSMKKKMKLSQGRCPESLIVWSYQFPIAFMLHLHGKTTAVIETFYKY